MNIPHIPVDLSPLIFIDPVSAKQTASINILYLSFQIIYN